MKNITKLCFVPFCALALGCQDGASSKPTVSVAPALEKEQFGELVAAKRAAAERLRDLVPTWNSTKLLQDSDSPMSVHALNQPRDVARGFIRADFDFVARRADGLDVFRSTEGQWTLKTNPTRGAWELMGFPASVEEGPESFSLANASAEADRIADVLEIPGSERGERIETSVRSRLKHQGVIVRDEAMARHVRIHREVNGLRVRDSSMMITFDLRGTPYRIERAWPKFQLPSGVLALHSRDEVVDGLADLLAERFQKGNVGALEPDISYHPMPDGTFEPIVSVWVFPADGFGSPDVVEYSLTSGPSPQDAQAASADDQDK